MQPVGEGGIDVRDAPRHERALRDEPELLAHRNVGRVLERLVRPDGQVVGGGHAQGGGGRLGGELHEGLAPHVVLGERPARDGVVVERAVGLRREDLVSRLEQVDAHDLAGGEGDGCVGWEARGDVARVLTEARRGRARVRAGARALVECAVGRGRGLEVGAAQALRRLARGAADVRSGHVAGEGALAEADAVVRGDGRESEESELHVEMGAPAAMGREEWAGGGRGTAGARPPRPRPPPAARTPARTRAAPGVQRSGGSDPVLPQRSCAEPYHSDPGGTDLGRRYRLQFSENSALVLANDWAVGCGHVRGRRSSAGVNSLVNTTKQLFKLFKLPRTPLRGSRPTPQLKFPHPPSPLAHPDCS